MTSSLPRTLTDQDIEARFRSGDHEAFMVLYTTHAPLVRAVVGRFFVRTFEREEAVQEVWLLAHRMARSFDPARGGLSTWLRTIAANRCKEILRAKGRRPNPDATLDDEALVAPEDPEEEARHARVQRAVDAFVAGLSAEEAKVFRLSLLEERTHDETAALTGLSPRRCKYLRMKLLLRASLHPGLRQAFGEAAGS